jgi:hypothetical protein
LAVALRLAREGYGGGDPEKVLQMRADIVLAAVQYESFRGDYERAYYELNKERG